MVRLHALGRLRTRFNDIGINRALTEEGDTVELTCLFFKDANEFSTNDLALLFGISHICELIQEAIRGIHINEVCAELLAEHIHDLFGFALTQETMVHMHAR